jgi:hypothetical protein
VFASQVPPSVDVGAAATQSVYPLPAPTAATSQRVPAPQG